MIHKAATLLLVFALPLAAQKADPKADPKSVPPLAERISGMQHHDGLLPLDWDAQAGKLYLEVPLVQASGTRSQDYLYVDSLPYGTGSNDLALDRGQLGGAGRIVHFERTGPKLLLVEPNLAFRTSSNDPAEQLAVTQSFPVSVLAGFKVEAESPSGTVLVDATDFFVRDVHGVEQTLAHAKQGAYKMDAARSTVALDATKAFPKNTEVEAILTFTTDDAATADFVGNVTPDPLALSVREHQSFLELPGPGFTSRRFSPRAGYFAASYREMNVPLGESLDQQFILRHRLIKRDPGCESGCVAVAPIQYYVDRGAPEPIRTALVEGARWWDAAFQAAGWAPNTFRVDLLPPDADPMDIRYNIIQWVHRYTRGWSYGDAVADPRTGEIIKGNVTLGSLRGRQDYLIAEALLAPYADGKAATDPAQDAALQMVLARIRQLSAHETGHTLGLAHNFAASSFPHSPEQTVSVMDYPHPWITLAITPGPDNQPDLSHAYPVGIGLWDKVAIDYGYREFDREGVPVEDAAALDALLAASEKTGLVYITDEDARPPGSAHPHAHLWDNGVDAADELDRILGVRSVVLKRFGENTIRTGTPTAQLEDTLVPVYLLHRYQTEAAIKEIAGLDYRYTVRGDGQAGPRIVPATEQRKALAAVLRTLSPATLVLPDSLLQQLPPRPPGLPRTRESFPSHTGLTFDPLAAAESAADLTLTVLFNAERASRLVEYHARDGQQPSLEEVIDAALAAARPANTSGLSTAVANAVEARTVEALLTLAGNLQASSQARAITAARLRRLKTHLAADASGAALAERISEFERDPAKFVAAQPVDAPPGMPIGDDSEF